MRNAISKSIKFVERPAIEHLKRQLDLLIPCFSRIIDHKTDLDLMMDLAFPHPQSPLPASSTHSTGRTMSDTSVMLRYVAVH